MRYTELQLFDLNYKYAQYANMYIAKQNLNKTLKFEEKKKKKKERRYQ